jgi:hypothetical protein
MAKKYTMGGNLGDQEQRAIFSNTHARPNFSSTSDGVYITGIIKTQSSSKENSAWPFFRCILNVQ